MVDGSVGHTVIQEEECPKTISTMFGFILFICFCVPSYYFYLVFVIKRDSLQF